MANSDSFFNYNSKLGIMIGTILMWFGLASLSTGINLNVTNNMLLTN